jgi:lycopene beta-cyclase
MRVPEHARIAVIGGGLAGLSLCMKLAKSEKPFNVDVFESRDAYQHDRHWCYFAVEETEFDPQASLSFDTVEFGIDGQLHQLDCHRYPYRVLNSGALYTTALNALQKDRRFGIYFSAQVSALRGAERVINIRDNNGLTQKDYDVVFDSRPASQQQHKRSVLFKQWFYGAELQCDHAQQNPVLMDFESDDPSKIAFYYLLPLAPDRLLLQYTCFLRADQVVPTDAEERWKQYLAKKHISNFSILRMECGEIPMQVIQSPVSDPRVIPIGTAAGWVRASTGYGYLDTQRACEKIVQQFDAGHYDALRSIRPRSVLDDRMDAIFLAVLNKKPELAPGYFEQLMRSSASDSLIRFLSGTASIPDRISVASSLPTWPFLRALPSGVW